MEGYNNLALGELRVGHPQPILFRFLDEVGSCEQRLVNLGEVFGLVSGIFREVSDRWHQLLAALATSRVQVTGIQQGWHGLLCSDTLRGRWPLANVISSLSIRLGVATVRVQCTCMLVYDKVLMLLL